MQVAILAGGLGTRLGALTERRPKSMVLVHGRPFLEHQIARLRDHGVTDVVACVGHLAGSIRDYFGDGTDVGVRIRYSDEGDRRLGTAGALKWAEPMLAERFFVLFGDSYLLLDYGAVMKALEQSDRPAVMTVWRNTGYERSDVALEGDRVTAYGTTSPASPALTHINYGLSALRRVALADLTVGQPSSLQALYAPLIRRGQLGAFEVHRRYYEIGSPRGLEEFERVSAAGVVA
jgi:NDP-sugar pyrophosphorylase family protein